MEEMNKLIKKNNYMMQIINLSQEIEKIKKTIEMYHAENQEENIMQNNINNEEKNEVNIENNNYQDNANPLEEPKNVDYDKNDLIDLMSSENSNLNPKETFITVDLSKNINNNQNNNPNNNQSNNNNSNNKNDSIKKDDRPIGESPLPIGVEPNQDESKNSLDDYIVEEIE